MSDSHKGVLDREYALETAKHFKDALDLLNELLDYGTALVPRAFVSSPRDLKAICVIFVQLRQFLVHLDGAAVLAAAGNCATATLQLRSLLETAHTMEWLLASDTEAKVNHLYVANLRQRRNWNSIAIPNSPEATRHADAARRLNLTPEQLTELTGEVQRTDALLARPPFDAINAKFEASYIKRGYDQPWYEVYAAPAIPKLSIRKISKDLGRIKEYSYIYSPFSDVTHGSDMWKSISVGDQNLQMNPVREPQGIPSVVQLAATLCLRIFPMVIQEYRSGEEESFNRKYLQEWRTRFFKEYHIELVPKDIVI